MREGQTATAHVDIKDDYGRPMVRLEVEISIMEIRGETVQVLVRQTQDPSRYTVVETEGLEA
ncbi:MAG: hypothetical protein R3330_08870 [Saprospiraceae bacterium]|nr:hypothetical protein [Saprospiraceae bacterium]